MRGRPQQISDDRLLDAAAAVLLRRGAAATTAEIAREAGISEGLVFYRHKSKDRLIAAVIERQIRPSESLRELVRDPTALPVERALRELVGQILTSLRRAFPYVEIARSTPDGLAALQAAAQSDGTPNRLIELASRYFEAEVARGRMRPLRTSVAGRLVVGVAIERTLSEGPIGPGPLDSDDDFLDGVVGLLLGGCLKPPAAPSSRRG